MQKAGRDAYKRKDQEAQSDADARARRHHLTEQRWLAIGEIEVQKVMRNRSAGRSR